MKLPALALILVTALLASGCGGGEDVPALATEAAGATPASSFNVVAEDIEFDSDTLVATAGREVVIQIENHDDASHNLAVYTEEGGDLIYRGELFTSGSRQYRFQAPPAGVYYFRCDAHPEMEGAFIAR